MRRKRETGEGGDRRREAENEEKGQENGEMKGRQEEKGRHPRLRTPPGIPGTIIL